MCCQATGFTPSGNVTTTTTPRVSSRATPAPRVSAGRAAAPRAQLGAGGGGGWTSALSGIGSLVSAIGGIWSAMEEADYKKKMLEMEKKRIKRERIRQNQFEHDMDVAYGAKTKHKTGDY